EIEGELAGPVRVRNRDRRHAVLEDVDLPCELLAGMLEEVLDRALHAVARRLAGEEDRVVLLQDPEKRLVPLGERLAIEAGQDLGADRRIVLRQRLLALDQVLRRRGPDVRVEEPGLVDHADQSMAVAPRHAVRRPEVEAVLALPGQLLAVVDALTD